MDRAGPGSPYIMFDIALYRHYIVKAGALYSPTISIRRIDGVSHASFWHDVTSEAASRVELIFFHAFELGEPAIWHPVGASEILQRRTTARSDDAAVDVQDEAVDPCEGMFIHKKESKG